LFARRKLGCHSLWLVRIGWLDLRVKTAQEMGRSLTVQSEGLTRASFTLELPLNNLGS
jgi:hypothetical protein